MTGPIFRTPICDFFDIEYPIVLAGMGGVVSPSGPELTAAVSNAGGLGVLGGAFLDADELATAIEATRKLTDRPFGVDTLLPMNVLDGPQKFLATAAGKVFSSRLLIPRKHQKFADDFRRRHGLGDSDLTPHKLDLKFLERQVEVILDLRPPVYVAGLGDPGFMVKRAHQLGMKVGVVVGSGRNARKVQKSGVDFVVAQGHDGGGHNSRVGTLALIPQVVDTVRPLPVLGAGAIMDGRGIVAALALGAAGVWCGSVFLATPEADLTPGQKQAVVDGNESSTVVSKTFTGKPARAIRNLWGEEFEKSGLDPLPMPLQAYLSFDVFRAADLAGRADISPGAAGQGIGLVREIRPAADVLHTLVDEARELLGSDLGASIEG